MKITGRSSSITNAFINSIIPVIKPNEGEVKQALGLLAMGKDHFQCAYCGDSASEWDHLRPLVINQKPTGFISEIQNLIPACGKCNQSKGNKNWKKWIISTAPRSPKTRNIPDLALRIERITAYENWKKPTVVDFESTVGKKRWEQHWKNWETILNIMENSQLLATEINTLIALKYLPKTENEKSIKAQNINIETESQAFSGEQKEIEKVRKKLNRWSTRPNQICCKILNKYLELSRVNKNITIEYLKSELPELPTFNANFDQMKVISDRNHAKIFEMNNGVIEIWSPVNKLVMAYCEDIFDR